MIASFETSSVRQQRTARVAVLAASMSALIIAASVVPAMAQQKLDGLPLSRVVLFNSGVGFFEHNGQVDGNARVDFKFNVDDVNDLLKSMVLEDLGGGHVSTVTYASKDPITKTLQTFAIDLTKNPTLAELLSQIRGERVEIDAPNRVAGTILGIEKRRQRVPRGGDEEVVEVEFLNLLTDEGLRSVSLENLGRIKLANADLDRELQQALAVLAMGHATDKKTVTLDFSGTGARDVRVGYIRQTPIWKTSYRLVLGEDKPPFLQGWAIVENMTEQDWKDVRLTLVSGRPISFVMDLYEPLYVPRPTVEPELFASLRPQKYGQDVSAQLAGAVPAQAEAPAATAADAEGKVGRELAVEEAQVRLGVRFRGKSQLAANGAAGVEFDAFDPTSGVRSVADAADVGELFQYEIQTPVTLPRQQSAMLVIAQGSVEGEKLSIYNAKVHAKHPLNGLKLKNTTGLHLMQGPVTVFDSGAYAGDAQIEDLPEGGERLVSYALDLDTEVVPDDKQGPAELTAIKIAKGTLQTTHKLHRARKYAIKNSGDKAKKILVEYPLDPAWKLVTPQNPDETARDRYRFAVAVEPRKTANLSVEEEQVQFQQIALSNMDEPQIRFYLQAKSISPKVKESLEEVIRRKQELGRLSTERQQHEAEIAAIGEEQARIRENMTRIDRNTDLYARYVKKFTTQEDQIEKLRGQITQLTSRLTTLQQELDAYLIGLEVS